MFDLALLNCKLFLDGRIAEANVYASGWRIAKVTRASGLESDRRIDCRGLLVLPGAIDSHVHFREPGWAYKEDWRTGSEAAAAGGVTTVIDMPNVKPPTTTVKLLEEKRALARAKSLVDFGLHFGATPANAAEMSAATRIASLKVFMGSSTGDMLLEKDAGILAAFKIAADKGLPATVHAEDEAIVRAETERLKAALRTDALAHCEARPARAAVRAVERAVALAETAGNRVHILHVSSEGELGRIAEARKRGVKVTFEATPHHLFLDESALARLGNYGKMNPPLRSKQDRQALLRALASGTVDTVGSDHAPHTREEKEADVWSAPSGVPGVQTLLPLLLNEHARGNLPLARIVELAVTNPARIFGLPNKGRIAEGFDADFAVVDVKKAWTIRDEGMRSKCGWTPFDGLAITGSIEKAVVKGKLVFESDV